MLFKSARLVPRHVMYLLSRRITTTEQRNRNATHTLMHLKKLQCQYQIEDGNPIFLKAGTRDKVLYALNLIGCVVGVGGVIETIYLNARPTSWKTAED